MSKTNSAEGKSSKFKSVIITSIVAAFLVMVANLSLWVNNTIFDTQNFSRIATESLTQDSSRQALASRITEKALENRPVAKQIAGNTIKNTISGVFGSEQFKNVLEKVTEKLQILLTSERPEPVVLNLEGIKDFLGKLITVIEERGEKEVQAPEIPSEIVLIDTSEVPTLYKLGVAVLWISPLALIGAILLWAYSYIRLPREFFAKIAMIQGVALALVGLFSLLLGPLLRPIVLSKFNNPDGRTVIQNLFNDFFEVLYNQTYIIILLGSLLAIGGASVILYRRYELSPSKITGLSPPKIAKTTKTKPKTKKTNKSS